MIPTDASPIIDRLLTEARTNGRSAADLYRLCLVLDPGRGAVYLLLADLLSAQGAIGHARDAYYRADALLPGNWTAALRLARLEFRLGLYTECVAIVHRLNAHGVIDGNAIFYMAASLHYMGDHEGARAILNRFDPNAPSTGFVAYFQARISHARNMTEEMIAWLRRGIETMDNCVLRLLFNRVAFANGRDLEACAINAPFAGENLDLLEKELQEGDVRAAAAAARAAVYAAPWSPRVDTEIDRFCLTIHDRIGKSADATEQTTLWHVKEAIEAERAFARAAILPPSRLPAAAQTPRRVFDAFIFNDELDLLEYRLQEIGDAVEAIVLVESEWTFQGAPKPLTFRDNTARFARWAAKIVHIVVGERCIGLPWDQEAYQRNMILRGLTAARDDDIILVSDVDEIPRLSTIERLKAAPLQPNDLYALSFRYFRHFLNARLPLMWMRPVALPYGILKSIGPNRARELMIKAEMPVPSLIHDAGWHFSSLGGVEAELRKYRENSHLELAERQPNRNELERAYASGHFSDSWGRLRCVPIDDSFPVFVRANQAALTQKGWMWPVA